MKKQEEEIASTAGDISTADSMIGGKPMRRQLRKQDGSGKNQGQPGGLRKNKRDGSCRKMIKESDGYNFYQDNDLNIFEITDGGAKESYWAGFRQQKPQFWQQNEITAEMMNQMNQQPGRNFAVKINGDISFPMKGQKR